MVAMDELKSQAIEEISAIDSLDQLEDLRVKYLGKKGVITEQMKALGQLPPEQRKDRGAAVNACKQVIMDALIDKRDVFERLQLEQKLTTEKLDVTLPVRDEKTGSIHPITHVVDELIEIFGQLGFSVKEGPEIEDDFHNFTALNIPEHHPARQMQDTFYVDAQDGEGKPYVLRTHTSSVQIRTMQQQKPPFRFVAPGRVYRSDYDMTHTPMFHQIECLYVDKGIHMGHLKGCLETLLKQFFEVEDVPLRFRPSFFPFTEPSAEVDIGCLRKDGELQIGGGEDWLEILGCGMVHPNVLSNVGIDPEEYQGVAFGLGVERLAMLKYGAPDLRRFFGNDVRWLDHYSFSAFDIPSLVGGLSS
jgi:phenylalanyl-tRNA synthetase alpha chain